MANYLSLEEAAQKLGVSPDQLVDLRSRGKLRGFRDGASWKFPEAEIDRLSDEIANGSDLGLIDDGGSDLGIGADGPVAGLGSDVNLVASQGSDTDVKVVSEESDLDISGLDIEVSDELQEIDSAELQLNDPAIMHDSAQLDLSRLALPQLGSAGVEKYFEIHVPSSGLKTQENRKTSKNAFHE